MVELQRISCFASFTPTLSHEGAGQASYAAEVRGTKENDSVLLTEICNGKAGIHGYIMFASVKAKR